MGFWGIAIAVVLTVAVSWIELYNRFNIPGEFKTLRNLGMYYLLFFGVNALLAIGLYYIAASHSELLTNDQYYNGLIVGFGYQSLIRLKVATIEYNNTRIPIGVEFFYDLFREVTYKEINRAIRKKKVKLIEQKVASQDFDQLVSEFQNIVIGDELLTDEHRDNLLQYLDETTQEFHGYASDNTLQRNFIKKSIASYIISGNLERVMELN